MASDNSDYSDVISRRRFVELAGVAGAASLAGCGGGGGGTDTEGDGGSDGGDGTPTPTPGAEDYPDQRHIGTTTVDPTVVQYNPFNTSNTPQISHHILFEKYAQYNYEEGAYRPAAVEEWNFTGDEFVLTLRDDLTWSNGNEVTAEDVVTQLRIAEYDEDPMWSWASGVEATGDYEVTISVGGDVNPELVRVDVLQRFVRAADATYGEYLSDLEDGGDVSEVRGFADQDPVTNGPFTIGQKSEQGLRTTRMDDSPYRSNVNFGIYEFRSLGGNTARRQALNNLDVDSDYSLVVRAPTVADFPDAIEEVTVPNVFGVGLAPNFNHPHAGDRAVRQAIAHVINRQLAVDNSYPRVKQAPQVATPISADYQETWLGDRMGDYRTYGAESSQTDQASQVLQDAGYSKSNGTWKDADGNTVRIPIVAPQGWGDWNLALQTAVDQLNDFGFRASLNGTGDYFGDLSSPDDWTFIANTWLHGGPTPYPYYSLLHALHEPQVHAATTNYPGYTEQYGGSSADITVPGMDGGEMTVNPGDRLDELASTTDDATEQEIVRELAWVANVDLPRIPILEKKLQQWLTTDDWTVPEPLTEETEAKVQWASTWLPRKGMMNYRG